MSKFAPLKFKIKIYICVLSLIASARQVRRWRFHFTIKFVRDRQYFCCILPSIAPNGKIKKISLDFFKIRADSRHTFGKRLFGANFWSKIISRAPRASFTSLIDSNKHFIVKYFIDQINFQFLVRCVLIYCDWSILLMSKWVKKQPIWGWYNFYYYFFRS